MPRNFLESLVLSLNEVQRRDIVADSEIKVKISQITEHKGPRAKTYVFSSLNGESLPFFRAGQYISVFLKIGKSLISRPYSLSGSPKWALEGKYAITVQDNPGGFAADWMNSNLKVGDILTISAPLGSFCYDADKDAKNVVALAGGSGITPFLSMAYAIRDGFEDFNLTILNGNRTEESAFFINELNDISKSTHKVKVVNVLSDEEKEGFEHGFIDSELIKKYGKDRYSVFICGPGSMYEFLETEIPKLNLPKELVRSETPGITRQVALHPDFPKEAIGKVFTLTVKREREIFTVDAFSEEPVLTALERAGIKVNSRCRSGVCSWCKSRLLSGSCFTPKETGKKDGFIHLCSCFPVSDLTIEIT